MEECPAFKEQESKLESLTLWSPEWEALASKMKDLRCSSSKNNSVCCETNGGCFRSDLVFFRIKYFPYKKEHLTSKTIFDYRKCSLVNVYYFTLSISIGTIFIGQVGRSGR